MPTGLQVSNDSSVVVIDQDYYNYHFLYKETRNFSSSDTVVMTYYSEFDGIYAIKTTGAVALKSQSASSLEFFSTDSSASITLYAFDRAYNLAPSFSGVGLEVMDPSGNLSFTSAKKYMRVVHAGVIPNVDVTPNPYTYSGLPSGQYAIIYSSSRFSAVYGGFTTRIYKDFFTLSPNGFSVTLLPIAEIPGELDTDRFLQNVGGQYLLIDVSGL